MRRRRAGPARPFPNGAAAAGLSEGVVRGRSGRSEESDWADGWACARKTARMSAARHPLIPPHGGYRRLRAFHVAELSYDATQVFCDRFIPKDSRTHDQMEQAARSGRQNIAEGSVGSATLKKGELKLTNIARASLEELRLDYEDFLRQHGLRQWAKDSAEAWTSGALLCSGDCGCFGRRCPATLSLQFWGRVAPVRNWRNRACVRCIGVCRAR